MKSHKKYKSQKQTKSTNAVSLVYAIARLPAGASEIDLDEGYIYNEVGFRKFCTDFNIENMDYNDPDLLRLLADEFNNRCTPECEYDYSFQFVEAGLIEVYQLVDAIREDARNTVVEGMRKFMMENGHGCTCCMCGSGTVQ
jgi:hypothetical protein